MNKIKKVSETKLISYITRYKFNKEFFEVEATVFSQLETIKDVKSVEVFNAEVQDVDYDFYISGKRVKLDGFKELYEKIFGRGSYCTMTDDLFDEIEKHYLSELEVKTLETLKQGELNDVFNELLVSSCKNKWDAIHYADNYYLIQAAKLLHLDDVIETRNVPFAHGKSSECSVHRIINLNRLQETTR